VIKRELNIDAKLDKDQFCENCIYGKAYRLKFGTREKAVKPHELMSADVCGPFDEPSENIAILLCLKIITLK